MISRIGSVMAAFGFGLMVLTALTFIGFFAYLLILDGNWVIRTLMGALILGVVFTFLGMFLARSK